MRQRSRSGFTLVELLVVIGIIALLIGILMPALSRARATSRQIKCLSNIRTIGQIDAQYVAEYKKWHMPAYWGWSPAGTGWDPAATTPSTADPTGHPRRYWFQCQPVADAYGAVDPTNVNTARSKGGMICPDSFLSEKNRNVWGYTIHESYGTNYTQLPGSVEPTSVNWFWAPGPDFWNAWKVSQVLRPADKVFFADSTSEGLSVGTGTTTPNSSIRYFEKSYNGEDWSGEKHEPPHYGGAVAYRHNRGANVLFFDGHATWMSYDDMKYDPRTMSTANTAANPPIEQLRRWEPKMQ
jgi:prepilin-type processing-associated H-X9-DG protein/prepilin-type N-terminal cleavage/methylation domain-containing protein